MDWKIEEVDQKDVLKFGGIYIKPVSPKTMAEIERAYQSLKRQVAESQLPISIIELEVEQHTVTGLFDHGDVTADMLARATHTGDCMSMMLTLDGDYVWMKILPKMTYWDSYQFRLEGHPRGVELVRENLDL